MPYQFDKHYTLEQANAMIPHVRKLFAEVRSLLKHRLENSSEHNEKPSRHNSGNGHGTGAGNGNGNGNGNGKMHSATGASEIPASAAFDYSNWSDEKRHEAAYRLLNALQSQGIVIQDVERGLIDFPSIRNGREVFLCYELDDGASIGYYHDIDAGYAGRQKITETHQ